MPRATLIGFLITLFLLTTPGDQAWTGTLKKNSMVAVNKSSSSDGPVVVETRPAFGKVEVWCNVGGVAFDLAGKRFMTLSGRIMVIGRVPASDHEIRARKKGYQDWRGTVSVEEGETIRLKIRMKKRVAGVSTTRVMTTTSRPVASRPATTTKAPPPLNQRTVDLRRVFTTHKGKPALKVRNQYYNFVPIVDNRDYHLGLTYEQAETPEFGPSNFSMFSSAFRSDVKKRKGKPTTGREPDLGTVKMSPDKPFLIMGTEVTWWQYLTYLNHFKKKGKKLYRPKHATPVPEQDLDLPASGLSFLDIRGFVRWLQKDLDKIIPGLKIRLPHEFEWEMAARGEGSTRGHVWPRRKDNEARTKLLGNKRRPVGSSRIDRTSTGIFDMCGNVREWTTTVNNNTILANMRLASTMGNYKDRVLPWDPSEPTKHGWVKTPPVVNSGSQLMVVRGGANYSKIVFMMISLRRSKEWTVRDDWVGFRLVLVPKKGYDLIY